MIIQCRTWLAGLLSVLHVWHGLRRDTVTVRVSLSDESLMTPPGAGASVAPQPPGPSLSSESMESLMSSQ